MDNSAIIYGILDAAKGNGINPYYYLRYLFEMIPKIDPTDESALDKLLHWSQSLLICCIDLKT
ncbi:transposase domain-containing protein [Neobacillus pocheonensis]|uniref:transposase domain-containing protein n=1 Tax=Neobacillus pocheonensis TaxID=363869 RepID=UPI003D27F955